MSINHYAYLSSSGKSDPGKRREINEDRILLLPERGVFCVADGMGGESAGEWASQELVCTLAADLQTVEEQPIVDNLLRKRRVAMTSAQVASRLIRVHAQRQGNGRSGATVVMLLLDAAQKRRGDILHAGDSRLYRLRDKDLERLTVDHNVAAAVGASPKSLPSSIRNQVTRAIGIEGRDELERTTIDIMEGDRFLLCSDGLTDMVDDPTLQRMLAGNAQLSTLQLCAKLVEEANRNGGRDNISVIVVDIMQHPDFARPSPTLVDPDAVEKEEEETKQTEAKDSTDAVPASDLDNLDNLDNLERGTTSDTPLTESRTALGAGAVLPPAAWEDFKKAPSALTSIFAVLLFLGFLVFLLIKVMPLVFAGM